MLQSTHTHTHTHTHYTRERRKVVRSSNFGVNPFIVLFGAFVSFFVVVAVGPMGGEIRKTRDVSIKCGNTRGCRRNLGERKRIEKKNDS